MISLIGPRMNPVSWWWDPQRRINKFTFELDNGEAGQELRHVVCPTSKRGKIGPKERLRLCAIKSRCAEESKSLQITRVTGFLAHFATDLSILHFPTIPCSSIPMVSPDVESPVMLPSREYAHHGETYYPPSLVKRYNLDFTNQDTTAAETKPAKICFIPSSEEFIDRTSAKLKAGGLQTSVPEGWPLSVNNRMTWAGNDFGGRD